MITLKIKVDTVDKVKEFVNLASSFAEEMDVVKDRYVVDAKSIMGMFSMDLSKPMELRIYSDNQDVAVSFDKFTI